ncbi:hypothetical protein EBX31_07305 [bacterium]|nr:hypothetical protein [bacterium]
MRFLFPRINLFPGLKYRRPCRNSSANWSSPKITFEPEPVRKLTLREPKTYYPFPPPYQSHGPHEDLLVRLKPEGWVGLFALDRLGGRVRAMVRDWNMAVDSVLRPNEDPATIQTHASKVVPLANRAVEELHELAAAFKATAGYGDVERFRAAIDQICRTWHDCVAWEADNCFFRNLDQETAWRSVMLQGATRSIIFPFSNAWDQFIQGLPLLREGRLLQMSIFISSDSLWARRSEAAGEIADLNESTLPSLFIPDPSIPSIHELCPQLSEWQDARA